MSTEPPAPTPEVLPPTPAAAPAAPSAPAPRAFVLWWFLKKWAWRNSAAGLWLFLAYLLFAGARSFSGSFPPSRSAGSGYDLALLAIFWLLFICEFQLTQFFGFAVYTVSLPLWLPGVGLAQYLRRRGGTLQVKASPIKINAIRFCLGALFVAVFFWWPLPSRAIAAVLGVLAFVPGFYLLRKTLRLALAPGKWLLVFRSQLHQLYDSLKAQPVPGAAPESPEVATYKRRLIEKYEALFLPGVSSGILRIVVISYFSALLLLSVVYLGFLAALWLRALTPTPELLALALGRASLPNLVYMSVMCSLGVVGERRINSGVLPMPAPIVVWVLNIARAATGLVLVSAFFGSYSADIARAESAIPGKEPTGA